MHYQRQTKRPLDSVVFTIHYNKTFFFFFFRIQNDVLVVDDCCTYEYPSLSIDRRQRIVLCHCFPFQWSKRGNRQVLKIHQSTCQNCYSSALSEFLTLCYIADLTRQVQKQQKSKSIKKKNMKEEKELTDDLVSSCNKIMENPRS